MHDHNAAIPTALVDALRSASSVAILTGAGVSAASGLPTFRDALTGLWAQYRPEDLATADAFRRDPRLVWEWYEWRRGQLAGATPNAAHRALVAMQDHIAQFTLITQNVDGLHQQAGSKKVLELHGSLPRSKCFRENIVVEYWEDTGDVPPLCPHCGGLLRPDVVWFGESLPLHTFNAAQAAAESCEVFLSVGTSGQVEPAASLLGHAARHGAVTAIFNLESSQGARFSLIGPADKTLPALVQAVWPESAGN